MMVIILQELEYEADRLETIESNIYKGVYSEAGNDDWEYCLNECSHIREERQKQLDEFKLLIEKQK